MSESDETLVERALAARETAYAPYSSYRVGCALSAGGELFAAANVENASYGLATCAERNAVVQAVLAGHRQLEVVAVATQSSPPAAPCGLCLQTINEFADDPASVRVILVNPKRERREFTLEELFPHGFRPEQLATSK